MRWVVLIAALVSACGGEVDETHQGRLEEGDSVHPQDGSFYDAYSFRTQAGYVLEVELTSEDFDAFLLLNGPDGDQIAQNDDREDGDQNAALSLTLPSSGTYTVFANSREEGEVGAYSLTIHAKPPR
ncbi:MAG: PPC domain-containing protein [Myxococcota bacterium]